MLDPDQSGVRWASVTVGVDVPVEFADYADGTRCITFGSTAYDLRVWFSDDATLRRLHEALAEHFAADMVLDPEMVAEGHRLLEEDEDISPSDPRLGVAVGRAIDEAIALPGPIFKARSNGEAEGVAWTAEVDAVLVDDLPRSNGEAEEMARAAGPGDNHHETPEQVAEEAAQ